jgi:hypothetical protein
VVIVAETSLVVVADAVLGIIARMLLCLDWIRSTGLGRLPDNEPGVGKSEHGRKDIVDDDTPFRDVVASNWAGELEAESAVDRALGWWLLVRKGYLGGTSSHLSTKTLLQVPCIDQLVPRYRQDLHRGGLWIIAPPKGVEDREPQHQY